MPLAIGLYSSPQGDGNIAVPAADVRGNIDYTHPRKGTETLTAGVINRRSYGLYSSPQGDGNNFDSLVIQVYGRIILIPARGRKRISVVTIKGAIKIILIPAREQKPKKENHNEFTKFYRI